MVTLNRVIIPALSPSYGNQSTLIDDGLHEYSIEGNSLSGNSPKDYIQFAEFKARR